MFNIVASQLKPLDGAIAIHFIDGTTFRAVFMPHDLGSPLIKEYEQKSEHSFEHVFYMLYAKLTNDQSMIAALNSAYDHLPIPGLSRITNVKTRIDSLLVSPFVSSAIIIYSANDRVYAQVEWMGTKSQTPGCHTENASGASVQEAIDEVLKKEPLCQCCYVHADEPKKEPVCP